jgi:hypothetical protein
LYHPFQIEILVILVSSSLIKHFSIRMIDFKKSVVL